jgi:RNA polymerase sigma-70 factor (ECF subfamily)
MLKTLCGFSIEEIAKAFLANEETIHKRLYRAKQQFRNENIKLEFPPAHLIKERTDNVLTGLYLLFNEGYSSTSNLELIRRDLIEEACRLCNLLLENEQTNLPQANALLALMLFHAARLESRLDADENILLLEQQDRSLWDKELIDSGCAFLNKAMLSEQTSWYHIQAAIAYEHVSALTFEKTNWENILDLYNFLYQNFPSPVTFLNRTIAFSKVHGAAKAIQLILSSTEKEKLNQYYLLPATLGTLYFELNDFTVAKKYFHDALAITKSVAEKKLLLGKIEKCM